MKVCYFIQTHKNPAQIYRLVQTIKTSSPTAQVLIGHDFTNCSFQWHTLSRNCVEYVANFTNKNSSLFNYYNKTVLPEESIVANVLVNSKRVKICKEHKRYLEFLGGSVHPRILANNDYSTLTNASFHFARKFEQDTKILDMLDSHIFS